VCKIYVKKYTKAMLNVVETSTKNILPLPFLFVDIKGGFCPTANHLFFGGDSVREGFCPGGIMSGGDYVQDSPSRTP